MRSMRIRVSEPQIDVFEPLLLCCSLTVRPDGRLGIGPVSVARDEVLPSCDAARLKVVHEIPQRGPQDVMGEAWKPRDVNAECHVLFEREIPWHLAFHKRECSINHYPGPLDFVDRVR